jgi:hypothetical protein
MINLIILEVVEESIHKQHRNECRTQRTLRRGSIACSNDRCAVEHYECTDSLLRKSRISILRVWKKSGIPSKPVTTTNDQAFTYRLTAWNLALCSA